MAPSPAGFAAHMEALGIGGSTRVVVYDRVGMMTVGRAWWMLRYFGHDSVSILDGGFDKWTAEGRSTRSGPQSSRPAPDAFAAKPRAERISDLDTIVAGLDGGGAANPRRPRAGPFRRHRAGTEARMPVGPHPGQPEPPL